jgi:hypothetical protein
MQPKEKVKAAILSAISDELDNWLAKESSITNGYDYESQFMEVAQKISRAILLGGMGPIPTDRNKKKTSFVFWENRSSQRTCIVQSYGFLWDHRQTTRGYGLIRAKLCI